MKGGYLRECFSDEALAASEPLIETKDFNADELIELCKRANRINSALTLKKILTAAKHPKKVIKYLQCSR